MKNVIRMDHFRVAHGLGIEGGGGAKRPSSLKSVTHNPTTMNLSKFIPYLKAIQKI